MYSAYETLPADIKTADRRHERDPCRDAFSGGKAHKGFETVDDVSKVPGARQPLVRTHPETGKKCLFLGRRINAYIIGLPVEESEVAARFPVGTHEPGEIHLEAGMAGRRSRLVGQSLRDAPPRRLRPLAPAA